ncbi:protein shisa-2-like [Hoplias malabaricus]|uniref:protein shisa-2-like n=1 Tax=Hoplias malabaricus TaxID=27720 RepID=UPI003461E631
MGGVWTALLAMTLLISVGVGGEFCHDWRDSRSQWRTGFHCPERTDQRDARFCCGQCDLRFCCGDNRARVEQDTCADHNTGQDTHTYKEELPVYVPFLTVVCVFVLFVLLGSLVAVCFCMSQKPLPPAQTSQSPARESSPPPPEPPDSLPMTASPGTSCGSSSSLYVFHSAAQSQNAHLHNKLEKQQQQQAHFLPHLPNSAIQRTMTPPAGLHPLMFPTPVPLMPLNSYLMPSQSAWPHRAVPSPCPPGTSTDQRSSDIII